jgi:RimJ/RimL family protein N-acetyltransferase
MKVIETERLILRTWQDSDAEEYLRINQDPKVIEYLGINMTMENVHFFMQTMNKQFAESGLTFWAVEEKASGKLMGFIGLNSPSWEASFMPCIEIGWRIGSEYWGQGYATEGAKAALDYGFKTCGLKEILAWTVPANTRSIAVMKKIGMQRDVNGDFTHPRLHAEHPLATHVLYRAHAI